MLLSFWSAVGNVWHAAWPYLVAVLFFGIVIMVHETGHFAFARLFKVRVNAFALGMGPPIAKFGKGETEYSLRLFPIGGYCKMEGEDEVSTDERAFSKKPVWQRFIIVSAGAAVNLLLGLVIVAVMLAQQNLIATTQIRSFTPDAPSMASGLAENDKILKINGRRVFSQYDISFLMARDKDAVMDFTVERGGKTVEVDAVRFQTGKEDGQRYIVYDFKVIGVEPGFASVLKYAFLETFSLARIIWLGLFDLVTGQYGLADLSGPIGVVTYIAHAAGASTKTDFTPLLSLTALITINLGIFNLLPVPALDGGRLFFMLIEAVRRKPVPAKYENWIHAAGLVLLLIFMAFISLNDILRLIRG
ncbi:MAG TPA: site-2 protease family protein [Clostridiales bacterium]|nr:MAG: Regulator of sigma-W protease RasP [Firmicutes bacterium ADurb.Bin262]HOU10727.1 site-2 protease family protein [Clostridiales bacterium]HQH63707.1 site-2 protease family protein [Clostridiales bacterium]HQK73531.1 site-2 protease family protein [Clostridiales bacterium]